MSEVMLKGMESVAISGFDETWKIWPRKVDKGHARIAYRRALKKTTAAAILTGAKAYAATRIGQDQKFTVHLATWLNGERWDDELPPAPAPSDDVIRQSERQKAMTAPDPVVTVAERGEVGRLLGELVGVMKRRVGL